MTSGGFVAEGEPFNYTHFTGQGFKGDLVPIDNRALYEQVFEKGPVSFPIAAIRATGPACAKWGPTLLARRTTL